MATPSDTGGTTYRFIDNLELWLSAAGLIVVWAAVVVAPVETNLWKLAALTALIVSVLHGVLFWVVRRRRQRARAQAIHETREMLADVVKNQLAVLHLWVQSSDAAEKHVYLQDIETSIETITRAVDGLSEQSLTSWKRRYGASIRSGTVSSFEMESETVAEESVSELAV